MFLHVDNLLRTPLSTQSKPWRTDTGDLPLDPPRDEDSRAQGTQVLCILYSHKLPLSFCTLGLSLHQHPK